MLQEEKKQVIFVEMERGEGKKINPIRNEFKLSKTKSEFVYFFRMIIAQQQAATYSNENNLIKGTKEK